MSIDLNFPMKLLIGEHQILLHGIIEFLAIFIAFRYYLYLKKRHNDPVNPINRLVAAIGATLGALIGSHLLGAAENIPELIASPDKLQYIVHNKTLTGGLIGGLIGVELFKKFVNERHSTGDLFTFPLLLGIIIGRVACFTTGIYEETYGVPTTLPWGMDLGDGLSRHPVTLYEIVFAIILWIVLKYLLNNYTLQSGAIFKIFMIAYFLFRFLLDFIKPGWRFYGISTIQVASLCVLIYYGKYILNYHLLFISKKLKTTSHAN